MILLGGGALIFAYRYAVHNIAYTSDAYLEANVVPISPEVSGHVRTVYVLDNQDVKAGDPLFELDPDPFLYTVRQKSGLVAQTVKVQKALRRQLEAQVAEIAKMESDLDISKDHWRRAIPLLEQQFMSEEEGANIFYTRTGREPPTRSNSPSCRARSSLACRWRGNSVISSRSRVPRWARSK